MKNFKSLYGFGGRSLKIRDVCMDLEPYFKVHNFVSVHPKSIILGQMTNLNMIFQIIDWLKFETQPRSLLNFGMANKGTPLLSVLGQLLNSPSGVMEGQEKPGGLGSPSFPLPL